MALRAEIGETGSEVMPVAELGESGSDATPPVLVLQAGLTASPAEQRPRGVSAACPRVRSVSAEGACRRQGSTSAEPSASGCRSSWLLPTVPTPTRGLAAACANVSKVSAEGTCCTDAPSPLLLGRMLSGLVSRLVGELSALQVSGTSPRPQPPLRCELGRPVLLELPPLLPRAALQPTAPPQALPLPGP